MIQMKTRLVVADNSGVKQAQCIKVLGGTGRNVATLGGVIIAVATNVVPNSGVKKGDICRAVVVRTKKERRRKDGTYIRFDDNACVLIDESGNMKGKRIFGPIARELREKAYSKIISLAPEVV